MTIAQFYIIFDQNEGVCSAGDQLTGKVILKTVKPMDIKRVCIYFEGKAKSHWEVSKDDSHKCYKTKEFYIDDNKILYDRAFNAAPLVPAGFYTYPFSYHISRTFPSSFEGSKGYIRYTCKAVIEREKRYKTEEVEKSFSVIHHLDLNYHPAARDPGIVQHEESVDFCCCDEGSVFLQLKIEKSGFVPGELLHFIADCHNNSSRDIDIIYLDLLQNVTYKGYSVNVFSSGNPKYHTKTTPFELYESTRGVERHKYTSIKNSVCLPPMPPSKLEGCSIITTAYELRLKANIGAGVSCSMFITIGTVPLRERVNRGPIITRSTASLSQGSAAVSAKNVHPMLPRTDAPPSYAECVLGQSSTESRSQSTVAPTTSTTDHTTDN